MSSSEEDNDYVSQYTRSEEDSKIIKKLRKGRSLPLCSVEELKALKKPINRALYKGAHEFEEKKKKAKPSDIIYCKICGKPYKRSAVTNHKKTERHKLYQKVHDKFGKLLLED
jgi:hypothetical protein